MLSDLRTIVRRDIRDEELDRLIDHAVRKCSQAYFRRVVGARHQG